MKAQTGYEKDAPEPMTPTESFIESAGHSLNGLTLQPYTIERMWAADAMGLRYGRLSKAASRQFGTDSTYPGMNGDVAIVIWLCSLTDPEEVRAARREPGQAEELAIKFASEHKLASPKQNNFWNAYNIFLKIMGEVHTAYAEPDVEKKTEAATTK
jgi:hypothetical protein